MQSMRRDGGDSAGGRRYRRVGLLASSALLFAGVAMADPAPATIGATTLPKLSGVIAGQASVTQSGPAALQVTQSTSSAAVNWTSFSVGSQARVVFTDPSPQSITINRVIGPDPSVIAGQVSSNGQLVLTNQAGITIAGGAKIDAQSLVLSAPGITEANAKAGKLVFDQPAQSGASVNNQGTLTVAKTGLAALVAPSVANSGVIRAPFGTVVLAGAAAHTVDLYGDGLLAIDVTKQVTTAPNGGAALVTNSGTIIARGGNVELTASAVEGLVQNLVNADGRIAVGGGTVAIQATGGNVVVPATARISANARVQGNGGKVSVIANGGTTTQAGRISAQGAGSGQGGTVEVSGNTLVLGGPIKVGGAGGAGSILLDPTDVVVGAAPANPGSTTYLAPNTLNGLAGNVTIAATGSMTVASALDLSTPGSAQSLIMTAGGNIAVNAPITLVNNGYRLAMTAGGAIGLAAAVNAGASGTLDLSAGAGVTQTGGAIIAGTLLSSGGVGGAVLLMQPGNQIGALAGFNDAGSRFALTDALALTQSGTLLAQNAYVSDTSPITLTGSLMIANQLVLSEGSGLAMTGAAASQPAINLAAGASVGANAVGLYVSNRGLTTAVLEDPNATIAGATAAGSTLSGNLYSGNVSLSGTANTIGGIASFVQSGGNLILRSGTLLNITGPLQAANAALTILPATGTTVVPGVTITGDVIVPGTLSLVSNGTIVRSAGSFDVGTLTGSAVHLADFGAASNIAVLGNYSVTGSVLLLDNAAPLTIQGTVQTEFFAIAATGSMTLAGNIVTLGVATGQSGGSTLSVSADASGNALFQQIGVSSILPLNGNIATVKITLPAVGGTIVLNNLSAPSADLVVFNPGGTTSGSANVAGLVVMGRQGGTDLSGAIGGATSASATPTTTTLSNPESSYRMNACTVGSVSCLFGPVSLQVPTGGVALPAAGLEAGEIAVPLPGSGGRKRTDEGT